MTVPLSLILSVWWCSSGDSCSEWTHQDSPETVGGRSQCQLSEQGDDHTYKPINVALFVIRNNDSENVWSVVSVVITQNGVTAPYYASQEGHVTVVRLLLEKGADVNICEKVVMDFVSCTCMWTFSQLAVCYICMYVVYREQSVGSLHKHS